MSKYSCDAPRRSFSIAAFPLAFAKSHVPVPHYHPPLLYQITFVSGGASSMRLGSVIPDVFIEWGNDHILTNGMFGKKPACVEMRITCAHFLIQCHP